MALYREDGNTIVVDYYEGAYGPTIRIDIQTLANLLRVKGLFLQLARSSKQSVDFCALEAIIASGLAQLILKVVPAAQERHKKLERFKTSTGEVAFSWVMSSDGWKRSTELIDGLLEANLPGHQYLTEEGINDALIEIAYMEERIIDDPRHDEP